MGLALLVSACGGSASSAEPAHDSHDMSAMPVVDDTSGLPFSAPDTVTVGPQGGRGQFIVQCYFSQFLADDPIVYPGEAGASHLHQFFGAHGVNADSTYDDLLDAPTTCDQSADTASYWAPVLLDADLEPVQSRGGVAYYRTGPGVDPEAVRSFPAGLMLVAGSSSATEPQPVSVVAWGCDTGSIRSVTPPDCRSGDSLRMLVTFEDCWDGVNLRSPDAAHPAAHVAYSAAGACPASHPVHIPQLQFAVVYPPVDPAGLALSSGSIFTGHADFWNTWDQTRLDREVAGCLNRNVPCNVYG